MIPKILVFCACVALSGCGDGLIATYPITSFRNPDPRSAVVAISSDYPVGLAIRKKIADGTSPCLESVTETFGPVPGTGPISQPRASFKHVIIRHVPPQTWYAIVSPGTYYFLDAQEKGLPSKLVFTINPGERLFLGSFMFNRPREESPPPNAAPVVASYGFHAATTLRSHDYFYGPIGCPMPPGWNF
jgi:hypothetical protein